jgi:hypothetical protein
MNSLHFNSQTFLVFRCEPGLREAEQLIFFLHYVVLDPIAEFGAEQLNVIQPARVGNRWRI